MAENEGKGTTMKRHGHLYEDVISFESLMKAAFNAIKGKRNRSDCASLFFTMETQILRLHEELSQCTYRPGAYRTFTIYEPKVRRICAAPLRDRIVHHSLCAVIDPVFEDHYIYDTYACRKGKGAHKAVLRAGYFARRHRHVLKCDIKKFYERIDREVLKKLLEKKLKDRRLLDLASLIIDAVVPGSEKSKGPESTTSEILKHNKPYRDDFPRKSSTKNVSPER